MYGPMNEFEMLMYREKNNCSESTNHFLDDNPERNSQRIMDTCSIMDREHFCEVVLVEIKDLKDFHRTQTIVFGGLTSGMEKLMDVLNGVMLGLMKSDAYHIFLSGSASELYIRPCCPCLNDIDLICQRKDCVAVFKDEFTEAPVDVDVDLLKSLDCFSIIKMSDRQVQLDRPIKPRMFSLINQEFKSYCLRNGKTVDTDWLNMFWTHHEYRENKSVFKLWKFVERNSSAVTLGCGRLGSCVTDHHQADSAVDFVEAIKCTNWPIEITQWFNRERKYGWPNEDLRMEVIKNGCHIILIPDLGNHTCCKVSFSRAEQILISSWNRVQQIVYHLLRVLHKAEFFNLDLIAVVSISNYHLKTLMLWKCEESPADYWKENSILCICCDLLEDLKSRILSKELEHYFTGFNMFSGFQSVLHKDSFLKIMEPLINQLDKYIRGKVLRSWFDLNYLRRWVPSACACTTCTCSYCRCIPIPKIVKKSERWEMVYSRV